MYNFLIYGQCIPRLHIPLSACVVSILRLTSVRASTQSKDITWDKVYSAFYGAVEVNTGIICSCSVTLGPIFQRHLPFIGRWLKALGNRHVSLAFAEESCQAESASSEKEYDSEK